MMSNRLAAAALAVILTLWSAVGALAQTFDTKAGAAYVLDYTTGTVLLAKNADEPLPPASMSKLMTLYMAFEAIGNGRLDVNEELPVSQHAMDYKGSSMFLRAGETVRVEDLLRGIIVLSGNDASAVIAEALSPDGTEAGFARMMTDRARQLGMMHSTFANSNGWPAAGHRMSVHDLAILAAHIIRDYPTFYPIFSETEFEYDGRVPANSQNRNPILSLGIGADGLKTGHTTEAGYGMVGSAKQGDRRVIFVLTGMDSPQNRAEEGQKIINWAFRQFAEAEVIKAGVQVATADVWMGDQISVGLTVADDLTLLIPVLTADGVQAVAEYDTPIQAPIAAGQQLGELVITRGDLPEQRIPLIADHTINAGGFGVRLRTAANVLLQKIMPAATPESAAVATDGDA